MGDRASLDSLNNGTSRSSGEGSGRQHDRAPHLPEIPQPCGPLILCPWGLPQGLGAEERSCQDEVEEEEAQPGSGIQSPQHGENHLLLGSWSPGFCLPLPRQKGGAATNAQGHLTKGRSSRARVSTGSAARPETSSRGLVFVLLTLSANRCRTASCSSVTAQGVRAQTSGV